ncbi:MAG: efflux transporter periplasmic adaptor subunit [Acidobacteria bacterium CG_4_9_14_3_um_filter_49_7]|nr:MAG: efflux transporter periplasmic adaptor subunit [Acidobacteria bacterium CG_4_9_14_3_um_filter_49_7]
MLSRLKKQGAAAALIASVTTGLLMVACGPNGPSGPRPTPEVSVVTIHTERVVLTTELPGRTAPFRIAEIRPQVSGLIQKRLFTEGSNVKADQVLYQIDPAPYQAAYDQAKAAVAMAEANLPALRSRKERLKGLVAIHAVGQQDYDDAVGALNQMEAQLQASKASMESAKINLSYTPIKAPISGRIGRSSVTEGALVTGYQPVAMATIQQLDPVYIDVAQSTTELLRLKRRLADGRLDKNVTQNKVRIILEDGTKYPLEGTLKFRDVSVDPTTGSVILRVVVPNPDGVLLPGMFVRTVVEEGAKTNAILLSQQAVARDPKGDPYALVVDAGGKVAQRMLTLDRDIGSNWLVSSGLASGDHVIMEGLQKVRAGASVKTVPFIEDGTTRSTHENKAQSAAQSN